MITRIGAFNRLLVFDAGCLAHVILWYIRASSTISVEHLKLGTNVKHGGYLPLIQISRDFQNFESE